MRNWGAAPNLALAGRQGGLGTGVNEFSEPALLIDTAIHE